jgi:hypothetical protein
MIRKCTDEDISDEELEKIIFLAKSYGVSKVNLAFLIPEGRAKNDNTIKLPIEKYKEIVNDSNNSVEITVLINGIEYTIADTQKLVNELKLVLDNEDIGRAFYAILLNGYI